VSGEPVYNGINGSNGGYLPAPTDKEIVQSLQEAPLTPAERRHYRWWVERHGINDPKRAPVHSVDPCKISSAGWCVVFGPDVGDGVKDALRPLLRHRAQEAGTFYKEYTYQPGRTKMDFLGDHGAGPGPADPRHVPYYVLLVGDPRKISYRFQYELDVQYAVGRLCFESAAEYASYAQGVVDTEKRVEPPRPRRIAFFATSHPDDRATQRTRAELIEPLAKQLAEAGSGWSINLVAGDDAVKSRLTSLLGGPETPALLFAAMHGLRFDLETDAKRVLRDQGSLLCQDWPGREQWGERPIPPDFYFSADDLAADADLRGSIAVLYACYSAGTPETSDFERPLLGRAPRIAPYDLVSRLSQRLLGHPRGALAVLGHVDRAWTTTFSWTGAGQPQVFENILARLLDGHPLGSATEYVNQRHAELASEVAGFYLDLQSRSLALDPTDSEHFSENFSRRLRANSDARNFVVVGDPAVRLVVSTP
jgi:hypothetical protein